MKRSLATHRLSDQTSVRVYDAGDSVADRYTVVIIGPDWEANPGLMPHLGCGKGGEHFSQFGECKEGRHLGKLVAWTELDASTQRHITGRLT